MFGLGFFCCLKIANETVFLSSFGMKQYYWGKGLFMSREVFKDNCNVFEGNLSFWKRFYLQFKGILK